MINSNMLLNTLLSVVIPLLVIFSGYPVTGGRILLAGPQISSHLLELQAIGQALTKRGHSVFLAIDSIFPNRERLLKPGITAVTFRGLDTLHPQFWSEEVNKRIMSIILGRAKPDIKMPMEIARQDCSNMMLDDVFMSKVKALNFDILLYDNFYEPCTVLLAHRLSIPAVGVTSMMISWTARVPMNPAVTPFPVLSYSDTMTFVQRLINVALCVATNVYTNFVHNTTLLQMFAPKDSSWVELQQRSTMLYIVTRDYLLEWPEPQMPNVIHTPGVTTHPAGELPRQLKQLTDTATDGIIVLSFGSFSGQFPTVIIDKFLVAFSQLKQVVIFKMGGENNVTMPKNVPRNVHMLSWLPQNDLLGHPNTVLFITHCGNNGQYESLYHGVPMIGFPLFAEQHHNAFRMVHHGYGVEMNILNFTVDELVNNIHKVLEEKSFKMAIQKASDIVKSRPMTAQDTAAYWVEHVLKYGGEHLRTGAMDMPLYQFLMLDILLFVLVVCFLFVYILKTLFALVCRKCVRKQTKQKQQ